MRPSNPSRSLVNMLTTLVLVLNIVTFQPSTVSAHSWLDCTDMRDSGCAGFPLGYPSRGDIDINTKYTYLVKDRRPDAFVCQPGRQNIPGNNPFPIASVTPGQNLHLTWQPDGHLDDRNPSTIEIHWSGAPDQQLHTRSELTPSTILGTMIFATSANCDVPSEPNTWCHGHLTIPESTKPGTYQLVWWWKYDRNPHGEEYSTCFEINVSGSSRGEITTATLPLPKQVGAETIAAPVPSGPPVADVLIDSTPENLELAYLTDEPAAVHATTAVDVCPSISVPVVESTTDSLRDESLADLTSQPDKPLVDSFQDESLADLASQPDKPLVDVHNISVNQIVGEGDDIGYNVEDETGDLAGDAVNDEEDRDTSPQPVPSPSQLINCTVDSVLAPNRNGTFLTNSTVERNNSTNATIIEPPFSPDTANDPRTSHNQILAGLHPLDNSAEGNYCLSGTFVVTSVAVTLTLIVL